MIQAEFRGRRTLLATALLGGALFTAPESLAQTTSDARLTASGSVRVRYETIEGQPRAGFNASDNLLNIRTRLAAEFRSGALRLGGEIYDSRAYLNEVGTPVGTNEVNTFEPVQAYIGIDFSKLSGPPITAQAGRFTLNLGSRRLVAADDYRNTTNGYTGIRIDIGSSQHANATLIYTQPQMRLPDDLASVRDNQTSIDRESDALVLYGAIATLPLRDSAVRFEPSYFHLAERDSAATPTRDRRLDTFGLRLVRAPTVGAWDFDVEYFAQTGSISASTNSAAQRLSVEASFLHAELGYRWNAPANPRLALQFDYASGDEPGGDYERFDTLFGMRRSELAPAGLYNAVGRANLSSPGIRLEAEPHDRLDVFISWRALYLASPSDAFSTTGLRDQSGASGDFAGHQLDARLRYWLLPRALRFELNVVRLFKGTFFERASGSADTGDTAYVAADLTYSF